MVIGPRSFSNPIKSMKLHQLYWMVAGWIHILASHKRGRRISPQIDSGFVWQPLFGSSFYFRYEYSIEYVQKYQELGLCME